MRTKILKNIIWIWAEVRRIIRRTPVWFLVWLTVFLLYLPKPLIQGDAANMTLRYGPALQVVHGVSDFAYMRVVPNEQLTPWLLPSKSDLFSVAYHALPNAPMGTGWLTWPVYELAHLYGMILSPENVVALEGLAAGLLMALAAAVLSAIIRPRWGRLAAWAFALTFAFATPVWSLGSRCIWQECGSTLLLVIVVAVMYPLNGQPVSFRRKCIGWVAIWWAFLCQPACALAAVWLAIPSLQSLRSWKKNVLAITVVAACLMIWGWLSMEPLQEPRKWFAVQYLPDVFAQLRPDRLLAAMFGLLVSPNRGLAVFGLPAFVAMCVAAVMVIRQCCVLFRSENKAENQCPLNCGWWQARVFLTFVLIWIGSACMPDWDKRTGFGSAQLMPMSAMALLAAVPAWSLLTYRHVKTIAVLCLAVAIGVCVQWLGVTREWVTWNTRYTKSGAAWEMRNPLLRHVFTEGRSSALPMSSDYYYVPSTYEITKDDLKKGKYLAYGFAQIVDDVWTLPPVAGMWMILPPTLNDGFKMQLRIQTKAFPYNPQQVDIYMNGTLVGRILAITMNQGYSTMSWLDIASDRIKPGKINTLELRVRRAIYQTASSSALGVMFEGLKLEPLAAPETQENEGGEE